MGSLALQWILALPLPFRFRKAIILFIKRDFGYQANPMNPSRALQCHPLKWLLSRHFYCCIYYLLLGLKNKILILIYFLTLILNPILMIRFGMQDIHRHVMELKNSERSRRRQLPSGYGLASGNDCGGRILVYGPLRLQRVDDYLTNYFSRS